MTREDHEQEMDPHGIGTKRWQLIAAIGAGLVAFLFGVAGFLHGADANGRRWSLLDACYDSIRLFQLDLARTPPNLPWQLEVARFLAPIVTAYALIKAFLSTFRDHHRAFVHWWKRRHTVICGLTSYSLAEAKERHCKGHSVVVVEKSAANPLLSECGHNGIFFWTGDPAEIAVLKRARVQVAREIIIATPEDETNARAAVQILSLIAAEAKDEARRERERQNKIAIWFQWHLRSLVWFIAGVQPVDQRICRVQLENTEMRERLQDHFRHFKKEMPKEALCRLAFFDVCHSTARRLLVELPLDGPTGIAPGDARTVHAVILGFGRMGQALAMRAACLGHFANGKKLRVTIIDRQATTLYERFLFHYPGVRDYAICEIKVCQTDAESVGCADLIKALGSERDTLLHIFVCLDDSDATARVTLQLQELLADKTDCTISVRVRSRASLAAVSHTPGTGATPLHVFGVVDDNAKRIGIAEQEYGELIARLNHEDFVNRRVVDTVRTPETDYTLARWESLEEWIRESNRQQAEHIGIKVLAIGCKIVSQNDPGEPVDTFTPEEIKLLSRLEHARWNAERWIAGWTFADDKARRKSPWLIDWKDLPDEIKQWDVETVEDIPLRLAAVGRKVVRRGGAVWHSEPPEDAPNP